MRTRVFLGVSAFLAVAAAFSVVAHAPYWCQVLGFGQRQKIYALFGDEGMGKQLDHLDCYISLAQRTHRELVLMPFTSGWYDANTPVSLGDYYAPVNGQWRMFDPTKDCAASMQGDGLSSCLAVGKAGDLGSAVQVEHIRLTPC